MVKQQRIPWNKGKSMSKETKKKLSASLKGRKAWNKNIPCTDAHKQKISEGRRGITAWNKGKKRTWDVSTEFKKGDNVGIKNHKWKGDNVSYRNLHRWVERNLGKAVKCENCKKVGKEHEIHWSNNDHLYKRNLLDWTSLCAKCHAEHDKLLRRLKAVNSGKTQNGQP